MKGRALRGAAIVMAATILTLPAIIGMFHILMAIRIYGPVLVIGMVLTWVAAAIYAVIELSVKQREIP